MQDIYQTFEFYKIKESILEFSKSELGKRHIVDLKMLDYDSLINKQADLKEMISIVFRFGVLPIYNSADVLELIKIAKKTGMLTPRDLNLIANDVVTMTEVSIFIKKIDVSFPRINSISAKFIDLTNLKNEIFRKITSSLTVDDKASEKLHEIRTSIRKLERELDSKAASLAFKYGEYLSNENATIRDGHIVLAVKTIEKSKVLGAIYDVSDSGGTTFIEPLEIITINNKITSLKVEENEEVRRILKELTNLVLLQETEIINNNNIIGELDFLSAKAQYAIKNNHVQADISDNSYLDLIEAKHPLLDQSIVVANTYHLDEVKRIIVISGPNAGGKTVSLKTVGLLVLMHQSGLAIPVQKAKIGYFKNIYIDIGDNQSISDNLSTFSAHMSNVAAITNICKGKDLVILDELGTGTDPKEGEALALAVTESIISSHSFALISSHFSGLKELALSSPNIENCSMLFDESKLAPTYIFKMGVPGRSYGLEVAGRYGVKESILSKAKEYISNNTNVMSEELISTLQRKVEEATRIEASLKKRQEELEKEAKRLQADQHNFEIKRRNLLSSVENEKEAMLEEARNQVDEVIKSLSSEGNKLHDVIALKKKLESLEANNELEAFNEALKINDKVSIPSLEIYGSIKRINGQKAIVVSDKGLSLEIDINKLHKIASYESHSINKTSKPVEINFKNVPVELNIIGYHVDEGRDALITYLDNCRMKHMSKVRIIHGFGSGALRKMVHEYLTKQHDLTFRLGDAFEGGSGATVVTFNDR